jgi:hypothetical protein
MIIARVTLERKSSKGYEQFGLVTDDYGRGTSDTFTLKSLETMQIKFLRIPKAKEQGRTKTSQGESTCDAIHL